MSLMTFVSASHGLTPACLAYYSVLNVKALVGAFTQEKALVWDLLRDCENFADKSFEALILTSSTGSLVFGTPLACTRPECR